MGGKLVCSIDVNINTDYVSVCLTTNVNYNFRLVGTDKKIARDVRSDESQNC